MDILSDAEITILNAARQILVSVPGRTLELERYTQGYIDAGASNAASAILHFGVALKIRTGDEGFGAIYGEVPDEAPAEVNAEANGAGLELAPELEPEREPELELGDEAELEAPELEHGLGRVTITEAELERRIDQSVQAQMRRDARYINAESAEAAAEAEAAIEAEVTAELAARFEVS